MDGFIKETCPERFGDEPPTRATPRRDAASVGSGGAHSHSLRRRGGVAGRERPARRHRVAGRVPSAPMDAQPTYGRDGAGGHVPVWRSAEPGAPFIPLRLDDAPIKGSLAQFLYINWRPADREQEYRKLLGACRQQRSRPHAGARCLGEAAGNETRRPRRSKRRQSTQSWSESGETFQARRTGDSWLAGPGKQWRRLCWLSHGDETTLWVAEKCV